MNFAVKDLRINPKNLSQADEKACKYTAIAKLRDIIHWFFVKYLNPNTLNKKLAISYLN